MTGNSVVKTLRAYSYYIAFYGELEEILINTQLVPFENRSYTSGFASSQP
jgi:hypothetical protein